MRKAVTPEKQAKIAIAQDTLRANRDTRAHLDEIDRETRAQIERMMGLAPHPRQVWWRWIRMRIRRVWG